MIEGKVKAFLEKKGLELRGMKILIGVSGGPDSLALLHYFWSKADICQFKIVAAHVDHMFRGQQSLEEAQFVRRFCEEREIPFEMKRINVPKYMEESGKSAQIASRECRYRFFEEIMEKNGIDFLALGHHGDDQVETILMRLTRGSTGNARAGIPFIRPFGKGHIVRPFLCLNRNEIEDYCTKNNLNPNRDPSNEKGIYSRNRFRKEIMPFLKRENPHVHEQFQRFSEEIQRDEAFLQELTVQKMNNVIAKKSADEIKLNINAFYEMPIPLQRRGIQLILNYLYKEKPASLSALHIEKITSLMSSPHPSGTLNFPNGLNIIRSYDECYFRFHPIPKYSYRYEITEPGKVILPGGGCIIFEYIDYVDDYSKPHTLILNYEDTVLPLVIRTRKDGDRMTLKGMQGTKKVKNIFIDEKVPLHERDSWPIVTDYNGQILWIPGLKKFHNSIQTQSEMRLILLKYIK